MICSEKLIGIVLFLNLLTRNLEKLLCKSFKNNKETDRNIEYKHYLKYIIDTNKKFAVPKNMIYFVLNINLEICIERNVVCVSSVFNS